MERDGYDNQQTGSGGQGHYQGGRQYKLGEIIGGSYKLLSVIGRGGMGVVYLAEHLAVQRQVALKVLAPDRVSEDNFRRFEAEGKAIARLDHANIVKVLDLGTDGPDCLYYAMDLLQGISLAELIYKKGCPNTAETLEIFSQLCAGLGHAHRNGLVHRDVKPSNIILCPVPGTNIPNVKIIDFGLVKLTGEKSQLAQSQTATGSVFGSPFYMSPEQWQSKPVDERTDIYSLGCTLFECLTGRPPFQGKHALETAIMHQEIEPPRLRDVMPGRDFPENLEIMIERMLKKQPSQRHQSMTQVSQDLLRVKAGKSVSREPIFADGPLFQIDEKKKAHLEDPDRPTKVPIALFAVLGAVVILVLVAAAIASLSAWRVTNRIVQHEIIDANVVLKGEKESPEEAKAREDYANCPPISQGIVSESFQPQRVFNFPEETLGFVCWGHKKHGDDRDFYAFELPARGKVAAPVDVQLTLLLPEQEGQYARKYPSVLAKIGTDDFWGLDITETRQTMRGPNPVFSGMVTKEIIDAVSGWKALRHLDFYHCKVPSDAVLALNAFNTMTELKLRDALVAGKDLARVKWLKELEFLDVKGMGDVNPVLIALSGSNNLHCLILDMTAPSVEALNALSKCSGLSQVSFTGADMDDSKVAAVCNIKSLKKLSLNDCNFTAQCLPGLAKLQGLNELDLHHVSLSEEEAKKLKQFLPHCRITYSKAFSSFREAF